MAPSRQPRADTLGGGGWGERFPRPLRLGSARGAGVCVGGVPLYLPAVPAGGKRCPSARLLTVLMPTARLSHSAAPWASKPQTEGSRARSGSAFFSGS